MNGRLYDATLARFISADPHIQADSLSQSYNRYSYTLNNPLKYTDPSGYFFKKLFKKVKRALNKSWNAIRPYAGIIVGAVLTFTAGCIVCGKGIWAGALNGATVGAITGAASALANGGNVLNAIGNGILGGLMFGGIGGSSLKDTARIFAHGLAGGVSSVVQGSKFGRGFMSAGFAKFGALRLESSGGALFDYNNKGFEYVLGRATVTGVLGGTASELGGSKFSNGAVTAAFAQLVNGEKNNQKKAAEDKLLNEQPQACNIGCPDGEWEIDPAKSIAVSGYFGGGLTQSRQVMQCTSNTSCSCAVSVTCYGGGVGASAGVGVEGGKVSNAFTVDELNTRQKVITITGGPASVNIPLGSGDASWGILKSTGAGVFYQNCSSIVSICSSGH